MEHLKLITFDADDTLWDLTVRVQRGMNALAEAMQPHTRLDYQAIHDALYGGVRKIFAESDPQTIDYLSARRTVIFQMLEATGISDEMLTDNLLQIYIAARDADLAIFPDVDETLSGLRHKYKVGWITNGTSLPEEAGLETYFDFAINWHTLKIRKPNPQIFEHAAQLVGCEPSEIMHIGDSLESDVAGIQGVGGIGVWYNYQRQKNNTKIVPDHEIHNLRELLTLLQAQL